MNQSLDRSIQVLENALSTPGKSLLRCSKQIPKTSQHSLLRQHVDDSITFDLTILPHEIQEIKKPSFVRASNITLSESLLNGTAVKPAERCAEIFDRMFSDFFEISQMHESSSQIFQTMSEYIQSCTDNLELGTDILSKTLGKTLESASKENAWLEHERNIWRLVNCLYYDRLRMERNPVIEPIPRLILTEKQCVENLYKTDHLLRECQLIVDWLERNAADQIYGVPKMGHFTEKTIGWENTFHQLTGQATLVFPASRPIVRHLDPDAPISENLPLHDLDIEDDKRLCRQIFYEIRCGRLQEAQSLCIHCGHPWRAAMLEGWRLYHDPNFGPTDSPRIKKPVEGNPQRDLWKLAVWETCEDESLDPYWRATLGILCGNITPVLSVCEWWEDYLWAYLRVMIDIRVESEIRDTLAKKYHPMPEEYWHRRLSLDEIFAKMPQNAQFHKENIIHRLIIMDQPAELLSAMKEWLTFSNGMQNATNGMGNETTLPPQLLRFLAHLVLAFRDIGIGGNEVVGDAVVEAYVQSLIEMKKRDLIAFYTATLAQPNQVAMYAKFLETIQDHDERKLMLCHAEQAGLDVEAITKMVVENIRRKDDNVSLSDLNDEMNEFDIAKISALDWLIFYESQRLDAIHQMNAMVRHFLANRKIDAARQAFNKIPAESVDLILSNYPENAVPDRVQNSIREYLCYKAYLFGYEIFNEWFHHFHHGRPNRPAEISEGAGFTERVAHEHRMSQFKAETDRWKLSISQLTVDTKAALYNILLFPVGGWLVDEVSNESDECRSIQLKALREMCIPKVVFLLHTVMHESGEYKECVQLADLIACENKQIYTVFNKHKLSEMLTKIGESSLALMDLKKDPWGYETGC